MPGLPVGAGDYHHNFEIITAVGFISGARVEGLGVGGGKRWGGIRRFVAKVPVTVVDFKFYLPNFFNFSAIALNAACISLFLSVSINGAIFITDSA